MAKNGRGSYNRASTNEILKDNSITIDPESNEHVAAVNVQPTETLEQERMAIVIYQEVPETVNDPWVPCAVVGLIFSWLPIVGLLTFCLNVYAPQNSLRQSLARMALMVSVVVLIINIVFWSTH